VRINGIERRTVQAIGFRRAAIFRSGIITGHVHTPCYGLAGATNSGRFSTIEQGGIARASSRNSSVTLPWAGSFISTTRRCDGHVIFKLRII
jgi:hypothetical protein